MSGRKRDKSRSPNLLVYKGQFRGIYLLLGASQRDSNCQYNISHWDLDHQGKIKISLLPPFLSLRGVSLDERHLPTYIFKSLFHSNANNIPEPLHTSTVNKRRVMRSLTGRVPLCQMASVCSKPEKEIEAQSTACGRKNGQSCAGHNAPSNPPLLRGSFSLIFVPSSMSTKWHAIYKYSPESLVPLQPSPTAEARPATKKDIQVRRKTITSKNCTRTWGTWGWLVPNVLVAVGPSRADKIPVTCWTLSRHQHAVRCKTSCYHKILFWRDVNHLSWLAALSQRKVAFQLAPWFMWPHLTMLLNRDIYRHCFQKTNLNKNNMKETSISQVRTKCGSNSDQPMSARTHGRGFKFTFEEWEGGKGWELKYCKGSPFLR